MRIRPYHFFIENFRNFRDASFDLGKKITVISGQNGVGKSNILSLIASGSGVGSKSMLGSNFQPEFTDFFNIDPDESYEDYKLYLTYIDCKGDDALTKRLAFKNDTKAGRGIRIIPRTSNIRLENCTNKVAADQAKHNYGVGADGRVKIPTIYLSLSRLYPLGERKDTVKISKINKNNTFYKTRADEKYKEWYNYIIPNSIVNNASLTVVEKNACSRASLHMDLLNTPTLSQSIGQDNIGNIISALVDIYVLSMQDGYDGALLCIDEIDVSLHPDTQIRLLDLFDKLSDELSIQFVVSTHSLSVLKETMKKENKNNEDYKIVYIKNSMAPYVSKIKSYELLEADMFGSLSFANPKVRMYFEDSIGKELFRLLFKAFRNILNTVSENVENPYLRHSSDVKDYATINDRIRSLKNMSDFEEKVNQIPTMLGCEELIKICEADSYFKRVIFVLDGDARYKEPSQKPKIRNFLNEKYDSKKLHLNDRSHSQNICFFPDYFAPESFLYRIIYGITNAPLDNIDFWRSMDMKEETALYTTDKIKNLFSHLPSNYNNDNLKNIFKEVSTTEVWKFIQSSDIVTYYYSDYRTVEELLHFIENVKKAFGMTWPITLANKYS
jgi:AAA15 family ATPase/GTPase